VNIPSPRKPAKSTPLPADWEFIEIGDRIDLVTGFPFPSNGYSNDGVRLLRGSNVKRGKLDWDPDITAYWPSNSSALAKFELDAGDLVIAMDGSLVGRSYARLTKGDIPALLLQRVARIRSTKLHVGYLTQNVGSELFVKYVDSVKTVTAIPHISPSDIRQFKIAVPPTVEEQAKISNTLNDIDDLIASLDALIAKKRDIKQAAMQQLLTGKTRLPGFKATPMKNSAIGSLPSDWEVRSLGSLGDPVIGLTYRPVDVRETGTLVLRSSNVQDGALAFDNNVFVDPEVASRALVVKGDILICVRNGSRALIGKCAMISDEAQGMAFGAFMSVFRSPHSDFLFHQFQSNIIQKQIHEHLGATINQITNASLRSFQVPFPVSSEERRAIVTILSDMDAELTGLTVKLSKLNMVREGVMQQLLTGRIRLV
jgi:type I restriction enzyme S subunit